MTQPPDRIYRSPEAARFHKLLLRNIMGTPGYTIHVIERFVREHQKDMSWAVDVSHGHSDLSSILFIPFNKKSDSQFAHIAADPALATERSRDLLSCYEEHIFPKLTPEQIRLLLTFPNEEGLTPLQLATTTGNVELTGRIISALKHYALDTLPEQLTKPSAEGFTPLLQTTEHGNLALTNMVIDTLQDCAPSMLREQLTHHNAEGFTPLMDAVKSRNLEVVKRIDAALLDQTKKAQTGSKRFTTGDYAQQWYHTNRAGLNMLHQSIANYNKDVAPYVFNRAKNLAGADSFIALLFARVSPDIPYRDPTAAPNGRNIFHCAAHWASDRSRELPPPTPQELQEPFALLDKAFKEVYLGDKVAHLMKIPFLHTDLSPEIIRSMITAQTLDSSIVIPPIRSTSKDKEKIPLDQPAAGRHSDRLSQKKPSMEELQRRFNTGRFQ